MEMYKDMIGNKDEENMNLRRNLHTILYKNGVLSKSDDEGQEQQQENKDMMTAKYLLLSLNDWIGSIQHDHDQNAETKQQQNIEIVMKQCDISRDVAFELLNKYNNDASTAIFEYNQTAKSAEAETSDVQIYKSKLNEFEKKEKKYLSELKDTASIIDQLKESNNKIALELNERQSKYKQLETEYISLCNELDDISNTKHELETECDRLQDEVERHQSVLEETRISTQEVIEQEQDRGDKLMEEVKALSDANKVLLAQKSDLTKQLHIKLKNDLLSEGDNISNIQSLQNELDALNEENDSLKMSINALKDINKKKMNDKDEDIMELNTVINHLKLECEELKALQSDFIKVSQKYEQQTQALSVKKKAFNNLQSAFDALQNEMKRLKEHKLLNTSNSSLRRGSDKGSINADGDNEDVEKLQQKLNEMRQKYEAVTKQYQDVRAKFTQSQKYQIRLEHETASLRSTISKTAAKLQHMSNADDQIDRRIIIKLLVTFFDRWYNGGDTKEVISLISKILRFDDKQCRICKVGKYGNRQIHGGNSQGLWGYATSWISSGGDTEVAPDDNEKSREDSQDLGSLWVEFLLSELAEEASAEFDKVQSNESNQEQKTETESKADDDKDAAVIKDALNVL